MKNLIIILFILRALTLISQEKEIELIKTEKSECSNDDKHLYCIANRIISQDYSNSIMNIEIEVLANCGIGKFSAKQKNDTIFLTYTGFETPIINEKGDTIDYIVEYVDCECCFNIKYHIKGLENKEYVIIANNELIKKSIHKYKLKPVKFEIYNNDTINYSDFTVLNRVCTLRKTKKVKLLVS